MRKTKIVVSSIMAAALMLGCTGQAFADGPESQYKDGLKNGLVSGLVYELKDGLKNGSVNGLVDGLKDGLKNGSVNGLVNGLKNGELK